MSNHVAPQRNMRELDTLLDDLNRSRYSAGSAGHNNSSGGSGSNEGRPSVDSLLNELSNAVHKYCTSTISFIHSYELFISPRVET